MSRVASPEDDTVCTVLDFSKGTAGNTDILHCNKGGSVTDCCGIVNKGSTEFCNLMSDTLRFTIG